MALSARKASKRPSASNGHIIQSKNHKTLPHKRKHIMGAGSSTRGVVVIIEPEPWRGKEDKKEEEIRHSRFEEQRKAHYGGEFDKVKKDKIGRSIFRRDGEGQGPDD